MPQATSSTAQLVPEHQRLAFLPKHFGQRLMLAGELAVYGWVDRLSEDYRGGYWHYYEIPGSFYMAPAGFMHGPWWACAFSLIEVEDPTEPATVDRIRTKLHERVQRGRGAVERI